MKCHSLVEVQIWEGYTACVLRAWMYYSVNICTFHRFLYIAVHFITRLHYLIHFDIEIASVVTFSCPEEVNILPFYSANRNVCSKLRVNFSSTIQFNSNQILCERLASICWTNALKDIAAGNAGDILLSFWNYIVSVALLPESDSSGRLWCLNPVPGRSSN